MRCIQCNNPTYVKDSRPTKLNNEIKRRRWCSECGYLFNTYERAEEAVLMIIKVNGSREKYSGSKLEKSIRSVCHKRPVLTKQIKQLIDDVEMEVNGLELAEISSSEIRDRVMKYLDKIDTDAYLRYASAYKIMR